MATRTNIAAVISLAALAGCGNFGRVNQGQVIDYDRASGLVTLIGDSNYRDPAHPRFDILPPVTIHIPEDRAEMGPEPEPGKLLHLDRQAHRMMIYDPGGNIRAVSYAAISELDGVQPSEPRLGKAAYPIVDRDRKVITSYFLRYRKLMVFTVPAEYFDLPDDTWKMGDEIRYYYKDPRRALRLMNVSKTDLNKAGT
jgi:hypothetical protein